MPKLFTRNGERIEHVEPELTAEQQRKIDAFKWIASRIKPFKTEWLEDDKPKKSTVSENPDELTLTTENGRTETANARRLVKKYGSSIRYVVEWKTWIVWNKKEGRWKRDNAGIDIQRLGKRIAADLYREIGTKSKSGAMNSYEQKQAATFARESNKAKSIASMISLARSEKGIAIGVGELDADPMLLNCSNGTIDLRTGDLKPRHKDDLITKRCPTAYIPEASCPLWEQSLVEIFKPYPDVIGYMQRALGYCLTGDVREQVLLLCHGTGSNGKGTLLDAAQYALGEEYAGSPPPSLFTASKFDRHPAEVMTLHGKRFCVSQETNDGDQLAEAKIKYLTGGDRVAGRGMFENFTSFKPTHKLILCTNHKPTVRGTDFAIWRRLKLIPFEVRFEGKTIDKQLPSKLMAEAIGILAWMVKGCLEWQRGGLREPDAVKVATEKYEQDQDVVGQFVTTMCISDEERSTAASELWSAFLSEFPDSGITQTAFGRELNERGYQKASATKAPLKGFRVWKGIALK